MSNFVTNSSHKKRKVALILCIFLGWLGVHHFYVGRYGIGILYLFTVGLFGFGVFFNLFQIIIGSYKDRYGNPLIEW